MYRIKPYLLALTAAISIAAPATAFAAATYTNPVIPAIGPADPSVICYKGRFYMYPTGDNSSYNVYTSDNLVNWTKGPKVFIPGVTNVWAPDVFYNRADRKFYLYYSANWKVGVAVADKPDGTFVDKGILVNGAIDAHLFQDTDGQYYLYFALNGVIYVQRMANPLQLTGNRKSVVWATVSWEITGVEGPWMIKHAGAYYLLYSGASAYTKYYAVGYTTASSPLGPFTKFAGNPIIQAGPGVYGPGHGSVTHDSNGNLWHMYHQKQGAADGWDRFICIDPMWFDPNGVLHSQATRATPQPAPVIRPLPLLDCDCDIDFRDFLILAHAWLSAPGQPNWDPNCDISSPPDDIINALDLSVLAENWLAGK